MLERLCDDLENITRQLCRNTLCILLRDLRISFSIYSYLLKLILTFFRLLQVKIPLTITTTTLETPTSSTILLSSWLNVAILFKSYILPDIRPILNCNCMNGLPIIKSNTARFHSQLKLEVGRLANVESES